MPKRVLILGSFGPFGQRLARALARVPEAECLLGAEPLQPAERLARELGVRCLPVDARRPESVLHALPGVYAVINTCGPFLEPGYPVAEVCAEHGVHYIDPGETREYVNGMARLARAAERSGAMIVTAASAAPAVSAALVDTLVDDFDRIRQIHTCLSPGARDRRELAAVRAILSRAGSPARMKERGRWREFHDWSRPRRVDFPSPLGRRRGYLCDRPDLDLFPRRYGATTVTFRMALPCRSLGLALTGIGWLGRRELLNAPPGWLLALVRHGARFLPTRRLAAGLRVEVRGERRGQGIVHTVFLLARDGHGPALAAAPIVALTKKWLTRGTADRGVLPCIGLLDWDEIRAELRDHDVMLIRR